MSSWYFILGYLIGLLLLGVLAFVVILNFLRYRFRGDRTVAFIGIFLVLCAISMIATLSLLRPITVVSAQQEQDSLFNFEGF